MRKPAKQFVSHMVTAISLGLLLLTVVILLTQNRDQSKQIQEQNKIILEVSRQIKEQNEIITRQTDINQKFLKCLVLVPQVPGRSVEERGNLVDQCIKDSKAVETPTESNPTPNQTNNSTRSGGGNTSSVPKSQPSSTNSSNEVAQNTSATSEEKSATRQIVDGVHELTKNIPIIKGIL